MTTFNTGNPIGSTDARDRLDNTENMDYLENSTTELTRPDRLGTVRKTRHGMEAEHDAQMQSFEDDFDSRLAGMAFTRVGTFTGGYTLTDMRQTMLWEISQGGDGHEYGWSGSFPKVVPAGSTPATSGGIGVGAWSDKTNLTLRSELLSGALTNRNNKFSLRDFVSVNDFGAVGDGVTDDTAAFVAAMASLGSKGGRVLYFDKHLINSTITVPAAVCIVGPYELTGIATNNAVAPYGNMAALILNSAATINLSGGAGINGALIYRVGMSFPTLDSSAFAGTAVTAIADDTYLTNSMVLGFNKAFYSNNVQRPTLRNVKFDCNNGIEIVACYDIAYVSDCHGWPFSTIGAVAGTITRIQRSGAAFKFLNGGDWNKVSNCFSYGYFRGFWVSGCNSMTLIGCGADSTGSYAGQLGFVVEGDSEDTRLTLCQAAAQETGYYISTAAGVQTRMLNCDSWACSDQGVLVSAGDASVIGGVHRNTRYGVVTLSSTSRVFADKIRFNGIAVLPFNVAAANADIAIGDENDYAYFGTGAVVGANKSIKTVASADPLLIYPNNKLLQVSGTTNFGTVSGGYAGRELTLIFLGVLTVFDGGANLKLNGNLVTAANTTLTLVHNGNFWVEKSRSVN